MIPVGRENDKTVICEGCGEPAPATQQENFPDDGWDLPYDLFGYYGGFTDNIRVLFGQEESRSISLCHECVRKIVDAIPGLQPLMDGGHGNHNRPIGYKGNPLDIPPCCRYCWESVYIGDRKWQMYMSDGAGGWRPGPVRPGFAPYSHEYTMTEAPVTQPEE